MGMRVLLNRVKLSPALVRAVPFVIFALLTMGQGWVGSGSQYWIYLGKTVLVGALLWGLRHHIPEMNWKLSLEGVLTGGVVFVLWVGLNDWYPKLAVPQSTWNPLAHFGQGSGAAWFFVGVRVGGSTLVVPPLEEVFYRSFLYRWIARPDFSTVPLGAFAWAPFLVTALVFGLAHYEWLGGILCGLAYQGLVCWKKRLGDAMTAHAITNALLGCWVVWKGAWHFW
jgi:CAAX prenyl protease-like protein